VTISANSPISLAIAIGIGLLIGSERERRKGSGAGRDAAGVRTFALVAFAGALGSYLQSEALLVTVVAAAMLLSALAYCRTAREDPGLTSEFALMVTVLLGALTMRNPLLAAGLSVVTTILLAARERLHRVLSNLLSEQEAHDALVFLAATLVITAGSNSDGPGGIPRDVARNAMKSLLAPLSSGRRMFRSTLPIDNGRLQTYTLFYRIQE
jgi:MgtC family